MWVARRQKEGPCVFGTWTAPPLLNRRHKPNPLALYKLTEYPGLVLETGYCKGSQEELILLLRQILPKMNRSLSGF
jgi:N-acetylmuramoyl-L-alanine amidase